LAATQARFRRPLSYPDTISIGTHITDIGTDRFQIAHVIVSHEQGVVTTEGQGTIVTYHYVRGEKVPIPDELRRRIEELEATAK
jgi:acyl-CoA thioester hydrolase